MRNYTEMEFFNMLCSLRQHAPIFWRSDSKNKSGYWLITDRELIDFVSKSPSLFSSSQNTCLNTEFSEPELKFMRTILINQDPPHNRFQRKIFRDILSKKSIEPLRRLMDEKAEDLVRKAVNIGRCEFVSEISRKFALFVICEFIGVSEKESPLIDKWASLMIGEGTNRSAGYCGLGMKAQNDFLGYGRKLFRDQQGSGSDIGLYHRLELFVEKRYLTEKLYCQIFLMLILAGYETSSQAIANGLYLLIRKEMPFESINSDPSAISLVVDEALRLLPPIEQFFRTATEDIEVSGCRILKGDRVALSYMASGQMKKDGRDEDSFDIKTTKDMGAHRSFGTGVHYCSGENLARMEMQSMFEKAIRHMKNPRFSGEIKFRSSSIFAGVEYLPIEFEK